MKDKEEKRRRKRKQRVKGRDKKKGWGRERNDILIMFRGETDMTITSQKKE